MQLFHLVICFLTWYFFQKDFFKSSWSIFSSMFLHFVSYLERHFSLQDFFFLIPWFFSVQELIFGKLWDYFFPDAHPAVSALLSIEISSSYIDLKFILYHILTFHIYQTNYILIIFWLLSSATHFPIYVLRGFFFLMFIKFISYV